MRTRSQSEKRALTRPWCTLILDSPPELREIDFRCSYATQSVVFDATARTKTPTFFFFFFHLKQAYIIMIYEYYSLQGQVLYMLHYALFVI